MLRPSPTSCKPLPLSDFLLVLRATASSSLGGRLTDLHLNGEAQVTVARRCVTLSKICSFAIHKLKFWLMPYLEKTIGTMVFRHVSRIFQICQRDPNCNQPTMKSSSFVFSHMSTTKEAKRKKRQTVVENYHKISHLNNDSNFKQ